MKIVLASKSPRRREILGKIVEDFEIITAPTDESLEGGVHPKEGVVILAERKGAAVVRLVGEEAMIISSDTLVELGGVPLGKPKDRDGAIAMLKGLSGRRHNVHTGVAVRYRGAVVSGVATTEVEFRELTDSEIAAYVDSGDPYDKAGAYGIQGEAGKFVKAYYGDLDTVIGLSSALTRELMEKALQEGEAK